MNVEKSNVMFALLRSVLHSVFLSDDEKSQINKQMQTQLLKTAKQHDLTHLIVIGLNNNNIFFENNELFEKDIFKAVYRYEQLQYEYDNLCATLEEAQISFVPLKGAVIRKYYPEPWMRTSCDIDILVKEVDSEKATAILVNDCGYVYEGKGSHDISLFAPSNVHIELHYELVEDGLANEASEVLKNVWNVVRTRDGYSYLYEMPDEMFYFYHIAHMAKHFENGGCGIRPFIDLWILDHLNEADKEKRDALLEQGNLFKFAEVARKLSRIWFEDEEYDPVSMQMENYILHGGVYGNRENRIAVQQQKKGGRVKYALSRIFLPYDVIKFHYPILQKHRWLTPFMEIRRWFKLLFHGKAKQSINELKYNQNISDAKADETKEFLMSIGL